MLYSERAASRITGEFSEESKVRKLAEAMAVPLDAMAEDLDGIKYYRFIDNAYDGWLDKIGEHLSVLRFGDNDDDYRKRIKTVIKKSGSSGTAKELIEFLKDEVPATDEQYLSLGAHAFLYTNGNASEADYETLAGMTSAGVSTTLATTRWQKVLRFSSLPAQKVLGTGSALIKANGARIGLGYVDAAGTKGYGTIGKLELPSVGVSGGALLTITGGIKIAVTGMGHGKYKTASIWTETKESQI